MQDLMPILSTLRRHKTAASLIVLEIALSFAIVCNALFLISQRYESLTRPSGAPEDEMIVVGVAGKGGGADADLLTQQDLAAMRALPGVKAVTIENQTLYGGNHNSNGVSLQPKQQNSTLEAGYWSASEGFSVVHGLKFVEGRDFLPEEIENGSAYEKKPRSGAVIVNRAAAAKLFPGRSAVGQLIYTSETTPSKIVGVVENLGPVSASRGSFEAEPYQVLDSERPAYSRGANYVLRVDAARKDAILKDAVAAVQKVDPLRIVLRQSTMNEMRATYYAQDR
ncbi:MAG TPA: ABC transporter permease, partial [Burkholderiaceae bacterium]